MKKKFFLLSVIAIAMLNACVLGQTMTLPQNDNEEVITIGGDEPVTEVTTTSTTTTSTAPTMVEKAWKDLEPWAKKILLSDDMLEESAEFGDVKFIWHITGCSSDCYFCILEGPDRKKKYFLSGTNPLESTMTPCDIHSIGCKFDEPGKLNIPIPTNNRRMIKRYWTSNAINQTLKNQNHEKF